VAEVSFGKATDSLDADGRTTLELPIAEGALAAERVTRALEQERARRLQVPPAVSAIKVDGERAYALARQGASVELAARAVQVLDLRLLELRPAKLRCEVWASKGYYVRSLARDLGEHLGVPAHLSALRPRRQWTVWHRRCGSVASGRDAAASEPSAGSQRRTTCTPLEARGGRSGSAGQTPERGGLRHIQRG
jgi:tRNA pseudouridine55 synthase